MSSVLNKIKTHDIRFKNKESIQYIEDVIMLTGEAHLLENVHGLVIETEINYPNIGEALESRKEHGPFYNHKIILSVGAFTRDLEFVPRKRPEGFTSSTGIGALVQFESEIKIFEEAYSKQLTEPKMRRLDTLGGITKNADKGSLFDLSPAVSVTEYTEEVVKRISLSRPILRKLLDREVLAKEFFDQIKEEMLDLGCPYYTFKRPDGRSFLVLLENSPEVEIRAYGYAKEIKK